MFNQKKATNMALSYLSGDSVGANKRHKKKKEEKKKEGKKSTRKKKVKRVAVAPARAAFLAVVNLNALKLATKLARIWKAPGGKDRLTKWWIDFGGQADKLKSAIAKGSKQSISGDEIGSLALGAALMTAVPIIIAVAPLIREFKAGGDATEMSEFDSMLNNARNEMGESSEFETGYADMPDGKIVGKVPSNVNAKPGGTVKRGDDDDSVSEGSFFSPLGLFFKTPLLLSLLHVENPILIFFVSLISSICGIGFITYSLHILNPFGVSRYTSPVFLKMESMCNTFQMNLRNIISRHG